jgi:hydroxymethylpyrimidine pyrophosphatase-like HAD family hydrolase
MSTNAQPLLDQALRDFIKASRFAHEGAVVTDLDGTAVLEFEDRIVIPDAVSHSLKRLRDHGRPVILNSLRFPLNVIRTFGREWYAISDAPLPLVSLNGGIIGHLVEWREGEVTFEEIEAFPLTAAEIDEVLVGVRGLVAGGIDDLVLFYYPRDWTQGELIWTPAMDKVPEVRIKYLSATHVMSSSVEALRDELHALDICMIFLLINAEEDQLMAYQHAKRSNFVTHKHIDKLSGLEELARHLGLDLAHAVGAGDTPMDSFLKGVGLAVHVGELGLEYKGLMGTVKVRDSLELGGLFTRLADLLHGESS